MAGKWFRDSERPRPSLEAVAEAERLAKLGYRRCSNAYRMIVRIDNPNWVYDMAAKLHRAPADFYVPGEDDPAGNWCGFYRSSYSSDKIEGVDEAVFRLIGHSSFDQIGYVELTDEDNKFIARLKAKCRSR